MTNVKILYKKEIIKMVHFEKLISRISWLLNLVPSVLIIVMTFLIFVDVFLRYIFNRPLTYTYDMVCIMLVVIASLAMPYTTLVKGHVAVDILMLRLSKRKQLIIDTITHIISIVLFLTISWQCFIFAQDFKTAGEVTPTIYFPVYPILYAMSLCFSFSCLVILLNLLEIWFKRKKNEPN